MIRNLRIFLLLLGLPFVLSNLHSQPNSFNFVAIDKQQGLPDNTVNYVFQDQKGFIWLCTGKGLARYDGNSFKLFEKNRANNHRDINSNRVTHIMEDNQGLLWISTSDAGVNVYNPEYENFRYFSANPNDSNSLGGQNINSCYQDSKGRIWICTLGSGLVCYDPATRIFKHYRHSNTDSGSIPGNHVTDIIEDANQMLWLVTEGNNLCELNPETGNVTRYHTTFKGMNMGGYFKKLYFTDEKTLWITTEGHGLYKFDIKTHKFNRFYASYTPGSINSNNIKGLLHDKSGNLLIISDGGGIVIMNLQTEKFTTITYNSTSINELSTNALYSIMADREKNIWIGSYKAGLLLLKENTRAITIVPQNSNMNGLSHKSVLSIYKDKEGITWYGTDGGGLNSYNPQTGKYALYDFNPDDANSISNNVVKAIHEDKDNNLWLATFFGGLNKLNKETGQIKRYTANSKLPGSISSNNTWCIFEDAQENLWIGNFSHGLDRFDKKTGLFTPVPQIYNNPTTLSHVQVSSLVQDSAGNIWVGTLAGLNKMNPVSLECQQYFHDATNSNSLSDDFITCMFYDSKNRLWIGTDDGGINLLVSQGVFRSYGLNGELPDRSILSIQEDRQGKLWISTKNGLVFFDPSTETFYTMDDVDDLISSNFNWNSSAIDAEGNLYFGSTNGVCIFNPSEIEFQSSFPSLVFTGVKVFNENIVVGEKYHGKVLLEKSVTYGGNVILTAKENAFTIEFVAIEFNKPAKIKYKYKLIGFDNDWVTTDAWQPNATYTNLPGGEYTFVLTSTNSSGIWSSDQIELQVTIIPPFYKRWWFKLILAMLFVMAAFVFYRVNIEKHRRKIRVESLKREKELIELRNIELKSEIASNTILLLNKNESLEQLKIKLVELKPVTENQPKIDELIQMIDSQMEADVYWEQFQYNFDQVYMNLLTRLKAHYPNLTRTNLKLCAYLRLNMSSKEIATLMNITSSGIDKARNRLRKKLDIQPSHDLSDFLMKF